MKNPSIAAGVALFLLTPTSWAQTVELVSVLKLRMNEQVSANQVNLLAPGALPFGMDLNVGGINLAGLNPAPSVSGPINNPEPFHNGGVLGYSAGEEEWRYGFPNFNDWGTTTLAELDGLFGSGTYTFNIMGNAVAVNLNGDLYPSAPPRHILTGGVWSNGVYVLEADQQLTLTTSPFTEYGTHAGDYAGLEIWGPGYEDEVLALSLQTNQSALNLVVPANSLLPGSSYEIEAVFGALSDANTSLPAFPGAMSIAGYEQSTIMTIVVPDHGAAVNYCVTSPNSASPGATISYTGTLHITNNDLHLTVAGCPANKPGLFFYGPNQVQLPFGNGQRCVGGSVQRLGVILTNGSGHGGSAVDFPSLTGANQILPGSIWNAQFWYRDPAAAGAGFNLSDGLSARFVQ